MRDFFKLLDKVARTDKREFNSILELTKEVALTAGYRRTAFVQKNGKLKEYTTYDNDWDEPLVAKWLIFFRPYIYKVLGRNSYIKEYHSEIIVTSFTKFFRALRFEKLTSNAAVIAYFKLTFIHRVGNALYEYGSVDKLNANIRTDKENEEWLKKTDSKVRWKKQKCAYNSTINHIALSLDMGVEGDDGETESFINFLKVSDEETCSVLLDLKNILKDNNVGLRLLESMLNSNHKLILSNLSEYMLFKDNELEFIKERDRSKPTSIKLKETTKKSISEAYDIILDYLRETMPDAFDKKPTTKLIRYSSSKQLKKH